MNEAASRTTRDVCSRLMSGIGPLEIIALLLGLLLLLLRI
jgi:hypothetical protein